jgi:arylsulfatase A-like enzyme
MSAPSLSHTATRALWAGLAAGVGAGVADVLWSWSRLAQFLPTASGKLRLLGYAAALHASFGALAFLALVLAFLAFRHGTALGPLGSHALSTHRSRRAHDPRSALAGLSLTLAGLPALAVSLWMTYRIGLSVLTQRHHKGLIVAVLIALTLGLCLAALLVTFLLGAVVERLLGRLLSGRGLDWASHPSAPLCAVGLIALPLALATTVLSWPTLAQLDLRPYVVIAGFGVVLPIPWRFLPSALPRRAAAIATLLVLAAALLLGAADAVRKAASAYTGLCAPLALGIRRVVDLDRDGHSALLGGGDCNDWSAAVYPGARETPDDGVDQNCLGGDLVLRKSADDLRFVPVPAPVPRDANVLLVTIDTLRADHVGAYGYARPTTPTLDALAKDGALFVNAWAHAPSTRYSMPALVTGRYPSQVLWDKSVWWPALRLENHTMAEIFRERGFVTGALLNYHYFDRVRRFDQGFDEYDNTNARLHQGRDPASTRGSSSREQADLAIGFLERHAKERFFLWVHFYDPHFEYERHADVPNFGDDKLALYDGEIRFTDEQLGRVLVRLGELGLGDKTIITVTGDHGEGFGEHGIEFHGYHIYAAQTQVPLVVRVPGLPPQRITTPVGHVDLVPTLANLIGAPGEATMDGRSLVAELSGAPSSEREVFQEVLYEGPTERRAVVTTKWHLIYNRVPDHSFELYDLERDPHEQRDAWGVLDPGPLEDSLLGWIDRQDFPAEAALASGQAVLSARPLPKLPVHARLGSFASVLGVDLSPSPVRAGQTLDLTWYFETVGEPPSGDWRVFVHIEGDGGRVLGDHAPAGGAYPVGRWKKGELIADRQTLTVPSGTSPGEYTLYMGLFLKSERLPVSADAPFDGGQRRVRAGTLRILPP